MIKNSSLLLGIGLIVMGGLALMGLTTTGIALGLIVGVGIAILASLAVSIVGNLAIGTAVGLGVRAVFYRLILKMDGWAAIEKGVRLRFADNIRLSHGVYLDEGVYLHACPNGIEIGPNSIVMHGAVLHGSGLRLAPGPG